jgi:phosphatidylserine/phosphatidylglycerophosphate/cardiolipin synthase-like enzyme
MDGFKYLIILVLFISLLIFIDPRPLNRNILDPPQEPESIFVDAFMCRTHDCEEIYISIIKNSSESLYCAFFEFNLEDMNNAIKQKRIDKIVYVDGDYRHFNETYIIYENRSAYMHNKFCIIDKNTVITGSFNPTKNGKNKNDNNIVVIKSKKVAEIYKTYFNELLKEHFSNKQYRSKIKKYHELSFKNVNMTICFSRGGNCLDKIKKKIKNAEKSIHALLFTMTDSQITNLLLLKHYTQLEVHAIFERSLITKYSSYHKLLLHNTSVLKDCNPAKMHHKVFVIDRLSVVTGSMNPSNNAENNNEENLIIIELKDIAEKFLKEFERVKLKCMM